MAVGTHPLLCPLGAASPGRGDAPGALHSRTLSCEQGVGLPGVALRLFVVFPPCFPLPVSAGSDGSKNTPSDACTVRLRRAAMCRRSRRGQLPCRQLRMSSSQHVPGSAPSSDARSQPRGGLRGGGGAGGLAPTSPLLAGDAEPACIHLPAFCTLRVCGTPTSPPSSDSFQWKASCISPSPPSPSRAFSACAKTALFFWLVTRARPGGKLAHAAGAEHLTELSAFLPALLLQLQRKTRSSRPSLL